MLAYIIISLATGLSGIVIYIYFLRSGQFDDLEDVKYQMFREKDEIPKN
jgi:cbb3-type cytochrome oxidase maturation protein